MRSYLVWNLLSVILISVGIGAAACFAEINPGVGLGEKVKDFTLKDYNGKKHSLYSLKGKKALVVMFIATECPVSNAYNERMVGLANDYRDRGVEFIGINSNKQERVEDIAKHAQAHKFNFTVLKDPENSIADYFSAQVTPETYVLDSNWSLRYHGRIDDNRNLKKVTSQDLRSALDAVLASKEVPKTETKAFGCTIKRKEKKISRVIL